jgi:nucleotide-binding universal stress UspA family protein
MSPLIIATDFSKEATNAAYYAADMALNLNKNLIIFHAYSMPVNLSEVPIPVTIEEILVNARFEINMLKDDLVKRIGSKTIITTELREGNFFDALSEFSASVSPYAVIIGCQGKTAVDHLLFGGHSVKIMKQLQWPVIAVPANYLYAATKRIALACDFEDVLETIPAEEIKMLVGNFNAELYILNIGKGVNKYNPEIVFESGMLQELFFKLKPTYHLLTGKIDAEIIKFADDNLIDLLIVIPKEHNLIEKIISGSKTKKLVLHSHVPVLSMHK